MTSCLEKHFNFFLKHLKNQIIKERDMFYEFSKKYYENAEEDYEFMSQTVEPYVRDMIKCCENKALQFDQYYTNLEEFTLKQLEINNHRVNFELKEKLVSLVKFLFNLIFK